MSNARLEARGVSKNFGNVVALVDVSLSASDGEVTCLLGDNGAGKSTLIKILSGVYKPDTGGVLIHGRENTFSSPLDARRAGIAVVYQDLAIQPLMPIWRNFFLGAEPSRGFGPVRWLDRKRAYETCHTALLRMGIDLRDVRQPIGTLSGGERQSVAISRALYFGARVLILDEPTAALGVRQAALVLENISKLREHGVAVILITHDPDHAMLVGDQFVVLRRGRSLGSHVKGEVTAEVLVDEMSGKSELARFVSGSR